MGLAGLADKRPRARRAVSLTSLIDVIFLLLLFFMLSSTFSDFGRIDLPLSGQGTAVETQTPATIFFLRASADQITLNGQPIAIETLAQLDERLPADTRGQLLISVDPTLRAQGLLDILAQSREAGRFDLAFLGSGPETGLGAGSGSGTDLGSGQ